MVVRVWLVRCECGCEGVKIVASEGVSVSVRV